MTQTMTERISVIGQALFGLALAAAAYACDGAGGITPRTLAQEARSIIIAKIKWCEWQSPISPVVRPQICRTEEIVPQGREMISQMDCMRGLMTGAAAFWFPDTSSWWVMRGGTCEERPADYLAWKLARPK